MLHRPGNPSSGALGEGRHARVGTAGGRPRGRSCDVSVPAKRQHLSLPPAHLQTHIHSRSPFRTGLTMASEGWKRGVPRLSNSRVQLERPGARVIPGMEKLPQTSQVPVRRRSQPAARAGVEEGGDGSGKDAELTCDPAGERFHSPSLLRGAPFCQPGFEAHREALPFSVGFLRSFRFPLSLPKGVTVRT